MTDRRRFLAGLAGGGAALAMPTILRAQGAAPKFPQPPLPYQYGALAPTIGAQTVELHYSKHHASYYANLARLLPGSRHEGAASLRDLVRQSAGDTASTTIFNNAGQAWNHELYWEQFKPGGAKAPEGSLKAKIDSDLGGLDKMKTDLVAAAGNVFGSGWGWLAQDPAGKLVLMGTPGGDNPVTKNHTPMLGIDVWEHAYYLDYQNRRPDHVKAVLDGIVNWSVVADRMKA